MTDRRNFTKAVKVEIVKRALRPDGQPACEKCGAIGCKLEVHHLTMDAMETDKSRKLTAEDGQLLCEPCHDIETKKQMPVFVQARDREASHLNVRNSSSRSFQKPEKVKQPSRHAPLQPKRLYV